MTFRPSETRLKITFSNSRPWRRQWHPTAVLLPGKSHGWRSLVAAVHGVTKSRTWLRNFTFTFHFHALEKEMATHSSVLAWRIPGMVEPGGLQSMRSHRVGHDWSNLAAVAAAAAAAERVGISSLSSLIAWLKMQPYQEPSLMDGTDHFKYLKTALPQIRSNGYVADILTSPPLQWKV